MTQDQTEGRVARRQRRNRAALIQAARLVMSQKGVDGTTMLEIAEAADVGAGTVYNYFKSKDELAIAVLEEMMHDLAQRIEKVTNTFDDPAQVYAFGIRTVLETATQDVRWKQLLNRSEVIADATFRRMGPFAIRDSKGHRSAAFSSATPNWCGGWQPTPLSGSVLPLPPGNCPPRRSTKPCGLCCA